MAKAQFKLDSLFGELEKKADRINELQNLVEKENVVASEQTSIFQKNSVGGLEDKKIKEQKDISTKKHIDTKTKEKGIKFMKAMVSADFKTAVGLFCVKNGIKEIDLIESCLLRILEVRSLELDGIEYNTNAKMKDMSKSIYGRYGSDVKIQVALFAKSNGYSEGYVIAQTVAKKIGWKKTL